MLILYNPPSSAGRKPVLPMSLLALGAVLEGEHEYAIIDGNLEPDPLAALDRAVRETGADILGVTVMPGPQLSHAVPQCRQLKAMHPRLTIVWGGYFPTQHYAVCLRAPYVDYVVRGYGELVFRSLVNALRQGDDPTALLGLAYRSPAKDTQLITDIVSNAMAPIPHPEHLPDFPYHRVDMLRYIRSTFLGRRTLSHHSSYGCPFFCNFCAVVNMVNGRWLAQSAERVANTVQFLVRQWGVDAVEFYDNNFFVHEARTAEFAERIKGLHIAWWGEARIDTLLKYEDRTWAHLRESGLKMVFLGAESGSDETLRRMNKGGTASTEKTLALAEKMRCYGIIPEFSFVLGNPPDPEADTRQTIEFIRRVKRINPQAEIILYMYTPVPLSGELYDQAKAWGFRFPETLEEWISPAWLEFSQRRSIHMPWLKDPLRKEVQDFEWVLNTYYPTATDIGMPHAWRLLLRAVSAWRYHLGFYRFPLELKALHRILPYRRPETSGF
ncbi:MAG: radical SAM protein [Anaerolineae bacterium]|nr:B12-binding domain-containing radical SAM protein [Anaerolineae bacterium]MDW8099027.1 radical SAM protein [Anaerolineae bacterium]